MATPVWLDILASKDSPTTKIWTHTTSVEVSGMHSLIEVCLVAKLWPFPVSFLAPTLVQMPDSEIKRDLEIERLKD